MGSSIKRPDNIAKLTKTSGTTLTLGPSTVAVGAFQYVTTGTLTLNTATVGVGGVDASVTAFSLYYIFAVVSSGNLALIASKATAPLGFSQSKLIGVMLTDVSGNLYGLQNTSVFYTGWYTRQTKELILTVTSTQPGWVTTRAVGIFYADGNNVWRMRCNIIGTFTSATVTNVNLTVANITFKTVTSSAQTMAGGPTTNTAAAAVYANSNTSTIGIYCASSTQAAVSVTGDVELDLEPTTYTIAANMEQLIYS